MRKVPVAFALVAPLAAFTGLIGAAASCAVEHHRENVRDKKKAIDPAADSAAPKAGSESATEGASGK